MSVGPEDVRRFARLARLVLDDGELERLTGEVNRILEHVDALAEVEAGSGEEEELSPSELAPTEAPEPLGRGPAELAPEWGEGFFLVPRLPGVDPG